MSLRRVKPQLEDYDDDAMSDLSSGREAGDGGESMDEDEDDGSGAESSSSEEEETEDEEEPAQEAISKISFGALAKAQKAISSSSSKATPTTTSADRIAAVKSQLAALKGANATPLNSTEKEKKARKTREELKRSSKHAPQEITSKRAVTRRREIVAPILTAATQPRDPRFDDAVKGVFDERVFKKNYGFLEDYREDEMKALKQEMTKTKDEGRKEELKKMVVSMQSKKQQQERKDRTVELVREHKKKEREAIKQGKKPFYLKKAEQKKMLLMDKYSKLNEKQLDKVVEKKRKRKAQKEHKNIPFSRREA
ncbi:rRNA biogenesis protein rrp36 [Maublancomyces gigas]|uniref:rRNA biogenesis protein RRP36 n=1 Tax=Discina gigas TaxID=1032678 RepID=A0ABR3G7I8_9PEZI